MHELTRAAIRLSETGQHLEAANKMELLLAQRAQNDDVAILDEHMLFALFLFNASRFEEAESALECAAAFFPKETRVHENLGIVRNRLAQYERALDAFENAWTLGGNDPNLHDGLCAVYGALGRMEDAKRHGVMALQAKDAEAKAKGVEFDVPDVPPRTFDPTNPAVNIIAFSLWGNQIRYTRGAVQNALLIPELYPGWTARFYADDTVPQETLTQLRHLRAEIVFRERPKTFYEGLLWRLEVVGDRNVSRYLIRDADSIVNTQERSAVDEWMESDRYFHIMRDWYSHTDLILAGLWGGVGGVLPSLETLLKTFKPFRIATRTYDQDLLRMSVWPTVRKSCLIHDSYFDCLESRPFPATGRLPSGMHVAQDFTKRQVRPFQIQDCRRPDFPNV